MAPVLARRLLGVSQLSIGLARWQGAYSTAIERIGVGQKLLNLGSGEGLRTQIKHLPLPSPFRRNSVQQHRQCCRTHGPPLDDGFNDVGREIVQTQNPAQVGGVNLVVRGELGNSRECTASKNPSLSGGRCQCLDCFVTPTVHG